MGNLLSIYLPNPSSTSCFQDLVLLWLALCQYPDLSALRWLRPLAFKCAQTSSILRKKCNLLSTALALPPTTKETLSLPSPQGWRLASSTHLFTLLLPTHASVLPNLNSAPTASPKLLLLRLLQPLCCESQRNFSVLILLSQHLTQSTPSFLNPLFSCIPWLCVLFHNLLPSTLPAGRRSSGLGLELPLLWLHLLLHFNCVRFLSLAKDFFLPRLRLASVSDPIAPLFYVSYLMSQMDIVCSNNL